MAEVLRLYDDDRRSGRAPSGKEADPMTLLQQAERFRQAAERARVAGDMVAFVELITAAIAMTHLHRLRSPEKEKP